MNYDSRRTWDLGLDTGSTPVDSSWKVPHPYGCGTFLIAKPEEIPGFWVQGSRESRLTLPLQMGYQMKWFLERKCPAGYACTDS